MLNLQIGQREKAKKAQKSIVGTSVCGLTEVAVLGEAGLVIVEGKAD